MLKWRYKLIIAWVVLLLAAILTVGVIVTRPKVITIDLSKTRLAADMPLPKDEPWDWDTAELANKRVNALFPGGRTFYGDTLEVRFQRSGDQIQLIDLELPGGSIDEVYALAIKFATDWGLPTTKIDVWHATAKSGTWDQSAIEVLDNSPIPTIELDILDSFDPTRWKPARISFVLDWPR